MSTSNSVPKRLIDRIARADNVPFDFETNHAPYYRLLLAPDPRPHGYVHPRTVAKLPWPASFTIDDDAQTVVLKEPPAGVSLSDHANAAFQQAVDAAIPLTKDFPTLAGKHSEYYRIVGAREFVHVERYAASLFGIAARGSHLTCFVREPAGSLRIWVARRSRHLYMFPGKLDNTAAGGVQSTDSPLDCVLAEAVEEASLPPDLVSAAVRSTGVITLATRDPSSELFHSEVLYTYDLELDTSAIPRPGDGEVEEFVLMDCDEVRRRMVHGEFKPNVCAVLLDFLMRHGIVTPESEPDYVDLCARMRRRLPVPMTSDEP